MAPKFERWLEKATSPTLLEPDWEGILNCVDLIRAGDTQIQPAVAAIRKRFHSDNPHVAGFALLVLEAAMKNCGDKLHREVVTKDMMEDLKHLAADNAVEKTVRDKVLNLIACWAHAFRKKADYKVVVDTHNLMKLEGFDFPTVRESDAMFVAESAPDWAEGQNCFRCRSEFGMLTRKHHCRNCGQIFCDKCSSRQLFLPHIGIEKEVRVCEACFQKLGPPEAPAAAAAAPKGNKKRIKAKPPHKITLEKFMRMPEAQRKAYAEWLKRGQPTTSRERPSSAPSSGSGGAMSEEEKRRREDEARKREEEELQLAMAISQSEEEEKQRQRNAQVQNLYAGEERDAGASYKGAKAEPAEPDVDPELARYLNRDFWEKKQREGQKAQATGLGRKSPTPSAPPPAASPALANGHSDRNGHDAHAQGKETQIAVGAPVSESETAEFATALKSQVEIFVNRIRSNQARGRSIVNDSAINNLFISLTGHHADVLNRIHALDDKRTKLEGLQDQLSHIGEARGALTALREETERERTAERLEEQRRRQIQMQSKLELMRVKKHEMLESQRLATLAQMQNHQTELQLRRQFAALGLPQPPPGTPVPNLCSYGDSHHVPSQIVYMPGENGQMVPTFAPQQMGYPPQQAGQPPAYDPSAQYQQQQHQYAPQYQQMPQPGNYAPPGSNPSGQYYAPPPPQQWTQPPPQNGLPNGMPQPHVAETTTVPAAQYHHPPQQTHYQSPPQPQIQQGQHQQPPPPAYAPPQQTQAQVQQPMPQPPPVQQPPPTQQMHEEPPAAEPPVDNLINFD